MKRIIGLTVTLGFLAICPLSFGNEAHVHGLAHMNLLVEEQKVEIELKSPLANFLSFEYEPETDAQKTEARNMVVTMHKADALFLFPAQAQCRLNSVSLESDVMDKEMLSTGKEPVKTKDHDAEHHDKHENAHEHQAGHSDLDARFSFTCSKPEELHSINVGLFNAFLNLEKVEVQMITPRGQGATELSPKSTTIRW